MVKTSLTLLNSWTTYAHMLSNTLMWGMLGDPDSLMWMWLMVQSSDAI